MCAFIVFVCVYIVCVCVFVSVYMDTFRLLKELIDFDET